MGAKERITTPNEGAPRPLLLVDVDGVISLFGAPQALSAAGAAGSLHSIEGIPHFLSSTAASHLLALWHVYEPVWASGWEEKANEYLPRLLGLPSALPFIRFSAQEDADRAPHDHWKLASIAAYVGERPTAWIDDAFSPACHAWARERTAPTLLVSTAPERGLTAKEAEQLLAWAGSLRNH